VCHETRPRANFPVTGDGTKHSPPCFFFPTLPSQQGSHSFNPVFSSPFISVERIDPSSFCGLFFLPNVPPAGASFGPTPFFLIHSPSDRGHEFPSPFARAPLPAHPLLSQSVIRRAVTPRPNTLRPFPSSLLTANFSLFDRTLPPPLCGEYCYVQRCLPCFCFQWWAGLSAGYFISLHGHFGSLGLPPSFLGSTLLSFVVTWLAFGCVIKPIFSV